MMESADSDVTCLSVCLVEATWNAAIVTCFKALLPPLHKALK